MSVTITRADEHEKRWQQWQRAYGKSSRRTAIQARIAIAIALTATTAWLGLQLFLSPVWNL